MGKLCTGEHSTMCGIKNMIWKIKSYSEKKVFYLLKIRCYIKKLFMKATSIPDMCT